MGALSKPVEIKLVKSHPLSPHLFSFCKPNETEASNPWYGSSLPPILETSKPNLKIPSVHVYSYALP